MENLKRINRTLIAKGSIIDYYKDEIETVDGNRALWDHIEHKGAAAMLAIMDDGKIVLVRQYRNSLDKAILEIPAGGIEPGEDTGAAAKRELEEETGYKAGKVEHLLDINTTVAFCNEKIYVYKATNLTKGETHLDRDEYVDVECYSLEEIIKMVETGEITDSKTISTIMYYATTISNEKKC